MGLEVLYLVRHGQAIPSHPRGDRYRALTPDGRLTVGRQATRAATLGLEVDLALSSPYLRALETRSLFAAVRGVVQGDSEVFAPEGDPAEALVELASWGAEYPRIAVFTHNPLVTTLAELLVVPGSVPISGPEALGFDTATVMALKFDQGFAPHLGQPEWILNP